MKIREKRIIFITIITLVIFIFSFFIINGFESKDRLYSLAVSVSGTTKKYSLESSKDGYIGMFFGAKNSITLTKGSHEITAKSEGLSDVKVSIIIEKDSQSVDIVFTGLTADASVKKQINSSLGVNVVNAKYFAQDTWIAGLINSSSTSSETEIIVLKKVKDDWETVEQGTYLDLDFLKSSGAPADLIEHVKSLQ